MYSEFVYVLRSGPYFKIGRTNDITRRIGQLTIQLPFAVELFKVINTDDSVKLEKYFHKLYKSLRVNGEWFKLNDATIADLFLVPTTVNCNGKVTAQQEEWDTLLDAVAEKMNRRAADKAEEQALEQYINEKADFEATSIPDCIGGALLSDYLAHECPYDEVDIEDMVWVVAEDEDEE